MTEPNDLALDAQVFRTVYRLPGSDPRCTGRCSMPWTRTVRSTP